MTQWRVRISDQRGNVLGTGFLIDDRQVLTCAHVVQNHRENTVRVSLPKDAQFLDVDATVSFFGPYTDDLPAGDIAVLTLVHPVAAVPAVLAHADELELRRIDPNRRELHVYGFPRGFDDEGYDLRVTAAYRDLHLDEWLQLVPVDGRDMSLQEGFSGAAVTTADTGEVVGMLVGAESSGEFGTGKLLPLSGLLKYWPELKVFLPLGLLSAVAARELCDIYRDMLLDVPPRALYQASLADGLGPASGSFATLVDVVEFLVGETTDYGQLVNRLERLGAETLCRLPPGATARRRISAWFDKYLSMRLPAYNMPSSVIEHAAVVVSVRPSAERERAILSVATFVGDAGEVVFTSRVANSSVRGVVERAIKAALGRVPEYISPQNVTIEFELPLRWLNRPVDAWSDPDNEPLGWSYPVIVRPVNGPSEGDRRRFAHQRWQRLCDAGRIRLRVVRCGEWLDGKQFVASLRAVADDTALALSSSPGSTQIDAALRVGMPIVIWRRKTCSHEPEMTDNACAGSRFIDVLSNLLIDSDPLSLLERVREARCAAGAGMSADFRDLTLLWDDPERRRRSGRLVDPAMVGG